MKKDLILLLLLFFNLGFPQGEANIWYFGQFAGLDFNSGSPVALTNGQLSCYEGSSVISTPSGQLLFYTNGAKVWNANHQVMPNGLGLLGDNSSTQSAIIVPKPGSNTIYYIFTIGSITGGSGLCYSEVDMSLNVGLGDVTLNKNVLIYDNAREKLTAIKNFTDNSYWIVVHGYGNDLYLAYKLTSTGLNISPVISQVGSTVLTGSYSGGAIRFSPDGSKLVCCTERDFVELLDFNINTGEFTNPVTLAQSTTILFYGAEFSPSGNALYISAGSRLYQYNLNVANIPSSQLELINSPGRRGMLQLGPDGKIYCARDLWTAIDVINFPDIIGAACNYAQGQIQLAFRDSAIGLPQFVPSFLNTTFSVVDVCLGSATQFYLNSNQIPLSVLWDFGDSTTSLNINPTHQYASSGNYNVSVTVTTNSGTFTRNKQITILDVPVIASTISNQSVCGSNNQLYNLSQFNSTVLGSQSTSSYGVAYFNSIAEAIAHSNVMTGSDLLSVGVNTYYAKVYNLINSNCNAITSFTVTLNQQPIANTPSDYVICENAPYNNVEQFDLSTKNSQVLNGQNASDYTITYHSSQLDADNDINPLSFLYTNTLPQETLYVRIESNLLNTCFDTTTLNLEVVHEPQLTMVSDFKVCDDTSNDGITTFDLTTKTTEILNGQSQTSFPVAYYLSLLDAQDETNAISAPINNTTNNQTIYYTIKVIGNANCKVIGTFNLIVNTLPIANSITNYFQCDDLSNDGIGQFDFTTMNSIVLGNQNPINFSISYHLNQNDANINAGALPLNYQNTNNPQTIFVRVENNQNNNCFAITSFQIGLYELPIANQPQNLITCDDQGNNGIEIFDLSTQTPIILGSQLATDFNITYHTNSSDANNGVNPVMINYSNATNPQTIYARIEHLTSPICSDIISFELIVRPKPEIELEDFYSICEGSTISVEANQGFTSYLWSNNDTVPTTAFSQAGNYSLTVTQDYGDIICDATKNFIVYNSNVATITTVEIQDWTDNENTISVEVTGDGEYEFSLDGINFQDSNQFFGLQSGEYTVFVRDKKGCGTVTENVFLLMYPKFFTPNADGINDYWQIKFSAIEPNLKIRLFNRHGKFIKEFYGSGAGWDGSFNGTQLPADDYWFVVTRANGKEYKGHFSLKK